VFVCLLESLSSFSAHLHVLNSSYLQYLLTVLISETSILKRRWQPNWNRSNKIR